MTAKNLLQTFYVFHLFLSRKNFFVHFIKRNKRKNPLKLGRSQHPITRSYEEQKHLDFLKKFLSNPLKELNANVYYFTKTFEKKKTFSLIFRSFITIFFSRSVFFMEL